MWLIPILVIGLLVAASRSPREAPAPASVSPIYLPAPAYVDFAPMQPAAPPSPISVLGELALAGRHVPPTVILCAIAEAEALGRPDIASDIVRLFVAPVVYAHERQRMSAPARAMIPIPVPPRAVARARGERSPCCSPREELVTQDAIVPTAPSVLVPRVPSALDMMIAPPARPAAVLVGVDPGRWDDLCGKLAREAPSFESSRHVGQYRQRRDRLAELGIDPTAVIGDAAAQRAALEADLSDAIDHLRASGMLEEHVGRSIAIPGEEEQRAITLSGLLGVVQAAGLDNAVEWLSSPRDRKKYPHTTAAFQRANGVF